MKRNYSHVAIWTLGLVIAASVPALAKNTRNLTLLSDTVLNGTPIKAGDYTIRWESHSPTLTVTFAKGKRVVVTAPAKMVDRGKTYSADTVVFNENPDGTRTIQEVRFAGSSQVIVFSE